jgi:hypothetical protein
VCRDKNRPPNEKLSADVRVRTRLKLNVRQIMIEVQLEISFV